MDDNVLDYNTIQASFSVKMWPLLGRIMVQRVEKCTAVGIIDEALK